MSNTYSIEQIQEAFDLVCNKEDWKEPINAKIKVSEFNEFGENLISMSIMHNTSTIARFKKVGKFVQVTAAGYRSGCPEY